MPIFLVLMRRSGLLVFLIIPQLEVSIHFPFYSLYILLLLSRCFSTNLPLHPRYFRPYAQFVTPMLTKLGAAFRLNTNNRLKSFQREFEKGRWAVMGIPEAVFAHPVMSLHPMQTYLLVAIAWRGVG